MNTRRPQRKPEVPTFHATEKRELTEAELLADILKQAKDTRESVNVITALLLCGAFSVFLFLLLRACEAVVG